MADLKNMKVLVIGGVSYNVGWSENDFTTDLKNKLNAIEAEAQVNKLEGVQVDGADLTIDASKKVNISIASPIATAKGEAIAAGALTIAEAAGTGNILKSYTFTQNGATVGTINLAKDLVVSGGEIVVVEGVKYLRLSIANQDSPVDIAVTDLVDVYGGSAYIDVATDNTISVKFDDLDAALVAESAQVGAAIKAVDTKADGIRTDLGQSTDAKNAEGSAFARIAQLVADINSLTGGEGSIETQINTALSALKGNDWNYADLSTLEDDVKAILADYLKAADKTELQNAINAKVAQATYDAYVAANDAAVSANTSKLATITEGANKVTPSYDEATATLTIAIA